MDRYLWAKLYRLCHFFIQMEHGFLSFTRIAPPHQLLERARHSVLFHFNAWVCFFFVICLPSSSIAQCLLTFVISYSVTYMQFLSFVLDVSQNEVACLSISPVCGLLLLALGCMLLHLFSGGCDRCFHFSYNIWALEAGQVKYVYWLHWLQDYFGDSIVSDDWPVLPLFSKSSSSQAGALFDSDSITWKAIFGKLVCMLNWYSPNNICFIKKKKVHSVYCIQ